MKIHEFTIYGAQKDENGRQYWPNFMSIKIPRTIQLEVIEFLVRSLRDEKMTEATLNIVGELEDKGEKSQDELFGPVDNAGK